MYVDCVACAVPGKAPAVTAGAYEIVQDGPDRQTRIKLYWQVRSLNVFVS